jgi:hypothetical protein
MSVMDFTVNASSVRGGFNVYFAIALNGGNVLIQDYGRSSVSPERRSPSIPSMGK